MHTGAASELGLPACHAVDTVLLMADRHVRASEAMSDWAQRGKKAVEFVEGKQWSEAALKKLDEEERPAFTFNKIAPLVRLVQGYHRNNRTDVKVLPGHDGTGTKAGADALTHVCKVISEINQEPYVDTEVFMDGIISGRGYYDQRLSFENNDYGEIEISARDPFAIKLDPDGDQYDLNKSNFVGEDRWVTIDEVQYTYGKAAAAMVAPLLGARNYMGGIPASIWEYSDEIAPWRSFGGKRGENAYLPIDSYIASAFDPARKNIRLFDCQHYIRVMQKCFLDLETGAREPIPDFWDETRIRKVLDWTEGKYRAKGRLSPLRVVIRPMRRVRWTTMIGDLIVFDNWSPYESFTITPFFPYFRRGQTKGMVDDLIDPQQEINKRRSSQIEQVTRTAHSGWKYHKNSLSESGKQNIARNGAMPGVNIEWQGEPHMEPKRIEAAAPPVAFERLETKGADDLREISGINESALGQLDRVQSGRALEARTRQAVVSIQTYMDNMSRTKELGGRKKIELIQNHYTEKRIYRAFGSDGKDKLVTINERMASGEIANNVTEGKYSLVIDETPLSSSFISAQFEEMMDLAEKGILPMTPAVKGAIIDASSIPNKDTIKQELETAAKGAPDPEIEAENERTRMNNLVAMVVAQIGKGVIDPLQVKAAQDVLAPPQPEEVAPPQPMEQAA